MFTVTADDIYAALGVPPASATDTDWAEQSADAANAYVGRLPLARSEPDAADLRQGTLRLAVALYNRSPASSLSPDTDMSVSMAIDNTTARLLRIGFYQKPVVA